MSKSHKKTARTVWCERGYYPLHYGFCPSKAAWEREMKRFGMDIPYPDVPGRCTTIENKTLGKTACIVTISEKIDEKDGEVICGLIAHEAMHVYQMTREVMKEDNPGTENEAYGFQMIFQELLEAYTSTRNPNLFRQSKADDASL